MSMKMLKHYRTTSLSSMNAALNDLKGMSIDEKIELLFYMIFNLTHALSGVLETEGGEQFGYSRNDPRIKDADSK